jgi:hypothetical protein
VEAAAADWIPVPAIQSTVLIVFKPVNTVILDGGIKAD